jgi:hypothetical protein
VQATSADRLPVSRPPEEKSSSKLTRFEKTVHNRRLR